MTAPIMNPALRDFWNTQSRFKVLYGGRGSSKSWDAAAHSVRLASKAKIRVLCTRMFQNRIEESVYTTIKKQIERFNLSNQFRVLNNKIYHQSTGSEFIFYGIARNLSEIKSLEGVDVLWLEEAESLTEDMWKDIEPTIRKEGSEIWVIFNPRLATDFAYQRFVVNPPDNAIVRKINYDENPFCSDTFLETVERTKREDAEAYEHVYLGVPKSNDEDSIIKRTFAESCVDAHLKLGIENSGSKVIGYDVADSGADKNAIVYKYGYVTEYIKEWKGGEHRLMHSVSKVYNEAIERDANIVYDSIGVGAGVGSKLSEMPKEIEYFPFNAGGAIVEPESDYKEGIKNKDMFCNLKAQMWWAISDRMRNTYNAVNGNSYDKDNLLSISSDCDNIEQLLTELSSPRVEYDSKGRVKVESKDKMLKRGIKSPNIADAFIMAYSNVSGKNQLFFI
jgi:phage terminase large subunit